MKDFYDGLLFCTVSSYHCKCINLGYTGRP